MVTVKLTLEEILEQGNDWEKFCKDKGWSEWAVNEGGGDIEVNLTLDEAAEYGIVPSRSFLK